MPVVYPPNVLMRKKINQTYDLFVNYTSTMTYEFLTCGRELTREQFKGLYCYLHPQCYDWESKTVEMGFKSKLYTLAVNMLSILLEKEVTFPLLKDRDLYGIGIEKAEEHLENGHNTLKNTLKGRTMNSYIKKLARPWKHTRFNLV